MTLQHLRNLSSSLKPSPIMPMVFVGHGSPMNALELNQFTLQWRKVAEKLPKPQAIVVISAHWQTYGTHVTSAPKQQIIFDMYGFPEELYRFSMDVNGDPDLAQELVRVLDGYEAALDENWGLDHGTWSVLAHIAPKPDVPVLQISLDMKLGRREQFELFSELAKLRSRGVLFIGSGNIVHNLRMANFAMPTSGYDWGQEFDAFAEHAIDGRETQKLINPEKFTNTFHMATPTDEHYRPLLAIMSMVSANDDITYFAEGMAYGSISMRSLLVA